MKTTLEWCDIILKKLQEEPLTDAPPEFVRGFLCALIRDIQVDALTSDINSDSPNMWGV